MFVHRPTGASDPSIVQQAAGHRRTNLPARGRRDIGRRQADHLSIGRRVTNRPARVLPAIGRLKRVLPAILRPAIARPEISGLDRRLV
jgi:hypothetical protein